MRADVSELVEMLLATPNMEQRTQGVGILDRQIARDYSPVAADAGQWLCTQLIAADHPCADSGNIGSAVYRRRCVSA